MLVAPPDTIVPELPQKEEWIHVPDHGIQIWVSQAAMLFVEAIAYCENLGGALFEPRAKAVFEDVIDLVRMTAGEVVNVWIGVTDEEEENVYGTQYNH